MEQALIGWLLVGARRFHDENRQPTYYAQVMLPEQKRVNAYVKFIDPRGIFIECACALIGRAIGLPIPLPILVRVSPNDYPEIGESEIFAFGSEEAGESLRKRVGIEGSVVWDKLREFAQTRICAVFDEWIANDDRNAGNILWGGSDNFLFIDHERAVPEDLPPNALREDNRLAQVLMLRMEQLERHRLVRDVSETLVPDYQQLPFSILSANTYGSFYLDAASIDSIIEFLVERLPWLTGMIEWRFDVRQGRMAI